MATNTAASPARKAIRDEQHCEFWPRWRGTLLNPAASWTHPRPPERLSRGGCEEASDDEAPAAGSIKPRAFNDRLVFRRSLGLEQHLARLRVLEEDCDVTGAAVGKQEFVALRILHGERPARSAGK